MYTPVLGTEPTDGDMLTLAVLLTVHDSVDDCPGWI